MTKKNKMFDNSNIQAGIEWGNIELPGLSDEELYSKNWNRGVAVKGRKRPEQSVRMSGANNPMAGKEHPSKGKLMPNISEKIKGKSKPEGFGEKISKAKKGLPNSNIGKKRPRQSELMSGAHNPMCRSITTPHGVFPSMKFVLEDEQSRGTKNALRKIRSWLLIPDSGYYYTDK